MEIVWFLHSFKTPSFFRKHIPSEDDFLNFRARCGEEKYREILGALVDIAYSLGFLSRPLIASADGTLFPTFSRFGGCDYFQKECQRIQITGLLLRIKRRAGSYLNHPEKIVLGKEYQVRARCPSLDTCVIKCPRLPSDIKARRGARRSKEDPSRLEYVFSYDKITLINLLLGIELPSDSITKEGSVYEGNYFIQFRERFKEQYPHLKITIDLGDGHYDDEPDYKWCRGNSSEPGFDYNSRNENLNEEALLMRGYDKNGTPFTPCTRLTKWKCYDPEAKRHSFSCEKECLRECPLNPFPKDCPHRKNKRGFSTKISVKAHPRLILKWYREALSTKRSKAIEPHQKEVIPTVTKMIWIS